MTNFNALNENLRNMKNNLEGLEGNLEEMKNDPLAHFEDEITEQYNDLLNELYGDQVDSLPFYCGSAAQLCEDKDPTFYRCGLNDYADSVDVSSFEEYQEIEGMIETLEREIEDLEAEIEELEEEENED